MSAYTDAIAAANSEYDARVRELALLADAQADTEAERDAARAEVARLTAEIARLQAIIDAGPTTPPTDPDPTPDPDPDPEPPAPVGRFGTHWPQRTPHPSADATIVECTWAAIATAAKNPAVTEIAVKPGTLGAGSISSSSAGVLSGISRSRDARVLIRPQVPGSVLIGGDISIVGCAGLAFVGFQPTASARAAAFGVHFRNCWNMAWAWSEVHRRRASSNVGGSAGDIEWVECVSLESVVLSDDRHRFTTSNPGSTLAGVSSVGCYDAPIFKPTGATSHTDATQVERQSSGGAITGIEFHECVVFGSASQTWQLAGIPDVIVDRCVVLNLNESVRRYPKPASAAAFSNPRVLNGSASLLLQGDSIITGTYDSSNFPMSGLGTISAPVGNALYAILDRDYAAPTRADLLAAWAL